MIAPAVLTAGALRALEPPRLEVNTLLVCQTMTRAVHLWHSLGRPENIKPIGIGSAVAGIGVNLILLVDISESRLSNTQIDNLREWRDHLRCRLLPGGSMLDCKEVWRS